VRSAWAGGERGQDSSLRSACPLRLCGMYGELGTCAWLVGRCMALTGNDALYSTCLSSKYRYFRRVVDYRKIQWAGACVAGPCPAGYGGSGLRRWLDQGYTSLYILRCVSRGAGGRMLGALIALQDHLDQRGSFLWCEKRLLGCPQRHPLQVLPAEPKLLHQ
jgi:hypothetical protein